jgi:hypothetical protein
MAACVHVLPGPARLAVRRDEYRDKARLRVWHRACDIGRPRRKLMKRILVGTLFFATVLACSNTTNNGSAAQPNAVSQTTTTGATTAGGHNDSSQGSERTTAGNGMPGAGDKISVSSPSEPQPKAPEPKLAVPRSPNPNPCSQCPDNR